MIWVEAHWGAGEQRLQLMAGEGLGVFADSGELCLSSYARELLEINLLPLLPAQAKLVLQLIIPRGRVLAERTSNAAFGVVEGLALIGNQAKVQQSAGPDALQQALAELQRRLETPEGCKELVLVVGENGLNLAPQLGISEAKLLKVGNWLGPLLAAAAAAGVERLLLFGYHGKLLKLAGVFFTPITIWPMVVRRCLQPLPPLRVCRGKRCTNYGRPPRWSRPWCSWNCSNHCLLSACGGALPPALNSAAAPICGKRWVLASSRGRPYLIAPDGYGPLVPRLNFGFHPLPLG